MHVRLLILTVGCGLLSLVSVGCSHEASGKTDADVKAFKGTPMPPDVAQRMHEAQQTAAAKGAAQANQGTK